MDSELDCDKMDYLLRDSHYCGVSYGRYDLERLLNSLTVCEIDSQLRLAVQRGGIHAVEEFILARYFMFVQVYFHRTRRLYDRFLSDFLRAELPDGCYPVSVQEYLEWDDARVWALMKVKVNTNPSARRIIKRDLISMVNESPTHSDTNHKRIHKLILAEVRKKCGKEFIIEDSADKLPHKIPTRYEIDDEKAIPVVSSFSDVPVSLSEESGIIKNLTSPINIFRIYSHDEAYEDAKGVCEAIKKSMYGLNEKDE